MMKIAALLLLGLMAGLPALADDESFAHKFGSGLRKGGESIGQGLKQGADTFGKGIKKGAESVGKTARDVGDGAKGKKGDKKDDGKKDDGKKDGDK